MVRHYYWIYEYTHTRAYIVPYFRKWPFNAIYKPAAVLFPLFGVITYQRKNKTICERTQLQITVKHLYVMFSFSFSFSYIIYYIYYIYIYIIFSFIALFFCLFGMIYYIILYSLFVAHFMALYANTNKYKYITLFCAKISF